MITPSFALTATERVLPSMALDFTTASLDSRVTFTRSGGTATVTNSSGNVATIGANLPRFDYDPIALTCKGLLIEESRVNYVQQSADLATSWIVSGSTIQTNQITSPDGTLTADRIIESAVSGVHLTLWNVATPVSNQNFTLSCYFKPNSRTRVRLSLTNGTTGVDFNLANFDLSAGTVISTSNGGNGTGVTASITNVGNGWYRCVVSGQPSTLPNAVRADIYLLNNSNVASYLGDGVSNLYAWGAQLEIGAFPTSLIPTAGSQVTRTPDVAVMTSTNFSSWYTATTGAAVVWAIPQTATGVRPLIQFDDTTALEIITLRGNVADPELYIVDAIAQAQIDVGTIVANTAYKLSGGWNTNNCAAAKDGGTVGTDVVATIPTPTQLRIGSDGTNYASALIQKVLYYPQRIINAEIQAISK